MEKITQISCSGGNNSQSKHPLIYLKINDKTEVVCPYCSKKFLITKQKNNKNYIQASDSINNVSSEL